MTCFTVKQNQLLISLWVAVLVLPRTEPVATAQNTNSAATPADIALVQPFLRATTCVVVRVDPSAVRLDSLPSAESTGVREVTDSHRDVLRNLEGSLRRLRELVGGQPIFATVEVPHSKSRIAIRMFVRKTNDEQAGKLIAFLKDEMLMSAAIQGEYIVAAPRDLPRTEPLLVESLPPPTAAAVEAFQSVQGYPIQVLILPPEHVMRTVRELSPELPRQLGGGPSRILTEGVRWLGVGIDPGKLDTLVVIQSASGDAARELADRLPKILESAISAVSRKENAPALEMARQISETLQPQVANSRVTIRVEGPEKTSANLALLAGIARAIEEKTRSHHNEQRLKQILLAIHNYYDNFKSFPPAEQHRNSDGKSRLSWRVHILPFLDAADLYQKFRLDEPWDSPHNKALLSRMPDIFASPGVNRPGHTTFLAPVGEKTIFGQEKSAQFHQITDGTSNTIAVVEVVPERAVPWTAPLDFVYVPGDPLNGVRRDAAGKWLSAFADGSVRRIRGDISPATALNLFQMNDGNPIDRSEL